MRFLVDRCAGRKLADWLRSIGHDVLELHSPARDPGDAELLRIASDEARILVTIDTDFGRLVHQHDQAHAGLIRLPDVPAAERIALMSEILDRYGEVQLSGAVVTVRGSRIRFRPADRRQS